jgi:hypothetical protein
VRVAVRVINVLDLNAPPASTATTDPDGRGRVSLSAPGTPVVIVTAPGFRTVAFNPSSVPRPIVLERGRDVPFNIRDGQEPVRGRIDWAAAPNITVSVSSDETGRGVITGLPENAIQVTAYAALRSVTGRVEARADRIDLTLPPGAVVEGRTIDEDGQPLAGVVVTLSAAMAPGAIVTEADGRFRAGQLSAGRYQVEFSMIARVTETMEVNVEAGQIVTLPPLVLRRGVRLTAQLMDAATGEPIPNPQVFRESNEPSGFDIREIRRPSAAYAGGRDGRIVVEGLPYGVVKLALDTPPYARTRIAEVEALETAGGDIDLGTISVGRGATLHLFVRDRGDNPRPETTVRLDQGPGISPLKEVVAKTDADGRAVLDRLGPGRYRLRVGGTGFANGPPELASEWFTIDGGGDIREEIVVGGVELRLTVGSGGVPLAHCNVSITADVPATEQRGVVATVNSPAGVRLLNTPFRPSARGSTGADGVVILRDVHIGPSHLSVSFPDAVTWTSPLMIPERNLDLTVNVPDTSAALLVRDERTLEVIRSLNVIWTAAGDVTVRNGPPAPDGTVTLRGLPTGLGKLTVSSGLPYETTVLALETPAAIPSEVLLKPVDPTTLRGRVVGDDLQPLKDAAFEFIRAEPPAMRFFGVTSEDGAIDRPFGGARPGPALLIVRRAGYASYVRRDVVLRPGMNDLGTIQMQRGYRARIIAPDDAGSDPQTYRIRVLDGGGVSVAAGLDDTSALSVTSGGEASIGLLAPGAYTVELVGARVTRRELVRISGSDTEVRVR